MTYSSNLTVVLLRGGIYNLPFILSLLYRKGVKPLRVYITYKESSAWMLCFLLDDHYESIQTLWRMLCGVCEPRDHCPPPFPPLMAPWAQLSMEIQGGLPSPKKPRVSEAFIILRSLGTIWQAVDPEVTSWSLGLYVRGHETSNWIILTPQNLGHCRGPLMAQSVVKGCRDVSN